MMRAPSVEVLRDSRERVRTGLWRGDARVAYLAPLPDAPMPSAEFLSRCLATLEQRGFDRVVTPALSAAEQSNFLQAGFEVQEQLYLLGRDLDSTLPPLPRQHRLSRARRGDRPAVLRLDETAFSEFWRFDEAGLEDALAATPATRFRVVRDDLRVYGYAISGRAGHLGFVQRLAVAATRRHRGIGRGLLLDGLHWMRRHGVCRAVVNTQLDNKAALGLYDQVGFEREPVGLCVLAVGLR